MRMSCTRVAVVGIIRSVGPRYSLKVWMYSTKQRSQGRFQDFGIENRKGYIFAIDRNEEDHKTNNLRRR